jgi:hypothetical protein
VVVDTAVVGTTVVGTVVVDTTVVGTTVVGTVVGDVTELLMIVLEQVSALPPPVAEPLHWLIVIGSAEVPPETLQLTDVLPA